MGLHKASPLRKDVDSAMSLEKRKKAMGGSQDRKGERPHLDSKRVARIGSIVVFKMLVFNAHSSTPTPVFLTLWGETYLDHGPRKTRTKTQTTPDSVFTRDRRNSDHGLSFWGGKTQTMV